MVRKAVENAQAWKLYGRVNLIQEHLVEEISWKAPADNGIVLNVDGYAKGQPGLTGAAGLFRAMEAQWLGGFIVNMGLATSDTT